MTTLRRAGSYGGTAPVQVDVAALAALLREKETDLRAAAERARHHLATNHRGDAAPTEPEHDGRAT